MNKIMLEKMQRRLDQQKVVFSTNENVITFFMNAGKNVGLLKMSIHVLRDSFVSYASLGNKTLPENFGSVSEYLHRANFGLVHGNFEVDFVDGEVRYKYSVEVDNPNNLSNASLDKCVVLPCLMFNRYGAGLLKLMVGDCSETPEALIAVAESDQQAEG